MSAEYEIERRCSFEKKPGIVQLSQTHLVWTPDSKADGNELLIAFTSIRQYQVSKEGSAKKAMIRLTCNDRDAKITLDFAKSFTDRDAIRDALNELRERGANVLASSQQKGSDTTTKKVDKSTKNQPTVPPPKPVSAEEMAWRKLLLVRKEVRKLHTKIVVSGAMTDEKFWRALRYRYDKNGQARATKGLSATGFDDTDEQDIEKASEQGVPSNAYTTESRQGVDISGWEQIIPTAAQRHIVFMTHPAVARARADKVPREMTEERFWEFFQASSMVARRGRNKVSKTDTTRMAEADAIFAPYQAREMDTAEKERNEKIKLLSKDIDLDRFDDHRGRHVLEGHAAGGDAPRQVREQGKSGNKSAMSEALRLMKQVNRHGELILEGEGRVDIWKEQSTKGRPLEDLEEEQTRKFVKLDVVDMQEKTNSMNDSNSVETNHVDRDKMKLMAMEFRKWSADLSPYVQHIEGSGQTLSRLLSRMKP